MIYGDGADLATMARLAVDDRIAGLTTNPSLMKQSGVTDYREFANSVLNIAHGKPVSFEVLADDLKEMERQAKVIASWGKWGNVYVKIPITNSEGKSTAPVIAALSSLGIRVNVTAVFTTAQAAAIKLLLSPLDIVSVFCGRIADSGVDPEDTMMAVRGQIRCKLLWASTREVFNVKQAERCGCDIITLTPDLIAKMDGFGRDLNEYSLATVLQFKRDAEGVTL